MKSKTLMKRNLDDYNEVQTITQFNKVKGNITMDDLKALLDMLEQKGNSKFNQFDITLIRVLNGDKWISFFDEDKLEEYYEGKVKDTQKFFNFSQVQITTIHR